MKSELFEKELKSINNENILKFTTLALDNLPQYFFEVAASSTGKYHPRYALGDGGLVRHTKAAVRFALHLLEIEQSKNQFTDLDKDCIISAIILHDGWKHGDTGSPFSTHDHPQFCADWIMTSEIFNNIIDNEYRETISLAVSSHMGEWNTSKRSKIVLNKPATKIQKFVHMCDYLASRKDIEVLFEDTVEKPSVNIDEYKLPFGKYKGQLLVEVNKEHEDYINWLIENTNLQEPLKSFISQLKQPTQK